MLAQAVPRGHVCGVDSSAGMIRFARKNFPAVKYPNLSFKVCDARRLNFHGKFNLAVSFSCLHWVKDHPSVLKGVRRSLKNGGRTFLQFGGKGNAADIVAAADKVIAGAQWKKYFRRFVFPWYFYGPAEHRAWVKKAGFKIQRIELVPKHMVQKTKEDMIGWLKSTWIPYLCRIPARLHDEFAFKVIEEYLKKFPLDESGCVHALMKRLEVEAIAK